MRLHLRLLNTTLSVIIIVVALGGCGVAPPTPQTDTSGVADSGTSVPVAVRTDVPGGYLVVQPIPTGGAPQPIPSGVVPRDIPPVRTVGPTGTPEPTRELVTTPRGDSVEATAILEKWLATAKNLRSVRATQRFMYVGEDGSRRPVPEGRYSRGDIWTDEWYDGLRLDGVSLRMKYRVEIHTKRGVISTLYDGNVAQRTWTGVNEVRQPWPDANNQYEFWEDLENVAMLEMLWPSSNVLYSLVGQAQLDGRQVIVLEHGNRRSAQVRPTRVWLDANTHLPYRIVNYSSVDSVTTGHERTLERLEINTPLAEEDFKLKLSPDVVTVHKVTHYGKRMPTYSSVRDAKKDADYVLFEPWENAKGEIVTTAIVEKSGKRSPVLQTNVFDKGDQIGSYKQGLHLPKSDYFDFFGSYGWESSEGKKSHLEIDGQTAEMEIYGDDQATIRLVREGTQIEVSASTSELALRIAREMRRVP